MMASEVADLQILVGKKVRTIKEFFEIALGTVGTVDSYYTLGKGHQGIMVKWTTTDGHEVKDGFGRDDAFDETQWLAIED